MTSGIAQIGKAAPEYQATAVVHGEFKEIKLADYRGKYVVLFFYPLDFTFICPTEIISFSERADEFRDINCEIIGASVDSHFTHLAWINTPRKEGGLGNMTIRLVSDLTRSICRDYGVLQEDAFRGLFITDNRGILRQITINDLPVGRNMDEILRLVQAFQFTDEHGEVCLVRREHHQTNCEREQGVFCQSELNFHPYTLLQQMYPPVYSAATMSMAYCFQHRLTARTIVLQRGGCC